MNRRPDAVEVTVDLEGHEVVAGILRVYERHGQSTTFEYSEDYLRDPHAYDLEPALPLGSGIFRPSVGKALFNIFADTAPDRWGQNLLRRQERDRAAAAHEEPRSLESIDFLFGVKDGLRQGALRFRLPSTSNYIGVDDVGIPQMVTLPRLLAASDRYLAGGDDLKDLIDAGGSLGGARPKAAVETETGKLAFAKFPRNDDQWDVAAWEQVVAELAVSAGITMPPSRLIKVDGRNVLLVERFDREGERRIGFASALTLLESADMERRSYVEIAADVIEVNAERPERDLEELFRRIVFSVLIANTDDHLRNHAFLRRGPSWNLSPAYDVNPNPERPRELTTAISLDDATASIELALSVREFFRLSSERARSIVADIEYATAGWSTVASRYGIARREHSLMADAFDSPEREVARRLAGRSSLRAEGPP
jgi:serine/threonine-protein kinase HipA